MSIVVIMASIVVGCICETFGAGIWRYSFQKSNWTEVKFWIHVNFFVFPWINFLGHLLSKVNGDATDRVIPVIYVALVWPSFYPSYFDMSTNWYNCIEINNYHIQHKWYYPSGPTLSCVKLSLNNTIEGAICVHWYHLQPYWWRHYIIYPKFIPPRCTQIINRGPISHTESNLWE